MKYIVIICIILFLEFGFCNCFALDDESVRVTFIMNNSTDHSFYLDKCKMPDNFPYYSLTLISLKTYFIEIYSVRSKYPYKIEKKEFYYTPRKNCAEQYYNINF